MASAGVENCFEVLLNVISILIESNQRNLDLTWNWLFVNLSIFETKAIECNMVISNKVLGYLNTIDHICSKFYGCDMHYSHGYLKNIAMITLLARIMILFHCYLISCFEQRNPYFWTLLEINTYDYEIIVCNVLCDNVNFTKNVIETINSLTIINIFSILRWIHGVELDGILGKTKNA